LSFKKIICSSLFFTFMLLITPSELLGAEEGQIVILSKQGKVVFDVEYAVTSEEKAKGLMYRKDLARNHGMLFVYQTPKYVTMWMKDTPMSLDMLFINQKGRIAYIEKRTEPESVRQINSMVKVSAVLEIAAGSADDFGISVGDEVKFAN
jgi:uncharacterized protein